MDAVGYSRGTLQAMIARNADKPETRRMLFSVGINIGEVIVGGDDIISDSVNIAARIQEICQPGGICLSGKVHDEVKGKLNAAFEDLGPQNFKNIVQPVPVFALDMTGKASAPSADGEGDLALPSKPSIAVLPFDNMSGDSEHKYFADGIADDILTDLARFRDLVVTARNSSFTYEGCTVDIKQVGRDLGVRYVL